MDQTLEKRVDMLERALTRLHPNWERELVASVERVDELRLQLRSLGKRSRRSTDQPTQCGILRYSQLAESANYRRASAIMNENSPKAICHESEL
jgi:hypothetical protein